MPDEPNATQTDSAKLLAEAIQQLVQQGGTTPSQQPSDPTLLDDTAFQQHVDNLVNEGSTSEALRLVQARTTRQNQQTLALGQQALGEHARTLAQQQIPGLADWLPDVEKVAKERNVDTAKWTSVKQWEEALAYTRALNIDRVRDEERKKLLAEIEQQQAQSDRIPTFARGSVAPDIPADVPDTAVTADIAKVARFTGVDPKAYLRNQSLLEKFDRGDGSIEKAPLIDSDVETMRKTGEVVIERGKF